MCGSAHSWWLYSAAPLRNQAAITMAQFPTESHYPVTEPTSPCPILIMPSTKLGSNKYQLYKSLVWLDRGLNPRAPACETSAILCKQKIMYKNPNLDPEVMSLWKYKETMQCGLNWNQWRLIASYRLKSHVTSKSLIMDVLTFDAGLRIGSDYSTIGAMHNNYMNIIEWSCPPKRQHCLGWWTPQWLRHLGFVFS